MNIVVDDLSGPQIASFLDDHVQQMRSITPLESKHALDLDRLRTPEITFWSVMDGDTLVGCGAIKRLDAGPRRGEVDAHRADAPPQRNRVPPAGAHHHRGQADGFTRLSLETGSDEFFLPARKLYEKFGFVSCQPFADYRLDPYSVFMTRML